MSLLNTEKDHREEARFVHTYEFLFLNKLDICQNFRSKFNCLIWKKLTWGHTVSALHIPINAFRQVDMWTVFWKKKLTWLKPFSPPYETSTSFNTFVCNLYKNIYKVLNVNACIWCKAAYTITKQAKGSDQNSFSALYVTTILTSVHLFNYNVRFVVNWSRQRILQRGLLLVW